MNLRVVIDFDAVGRPVDIIEMVGSEIVNRLPVDALSSGLLLDRIMGLTEKVPLTIEETDGRVRPATDEEAAAIRARIRPTERRAR